MGKTFKQDKSFADVFNAFTKEMEGAGKEFKKEFTEAINHHPTLGREAENFVYGGKNGVNNLIYNLGKCCKDLKAKVAGTPQVERETQKFAEKIEHNAEKLAQQVDKFARNKLGIDLEKVGKAFGNFFEKLHDAVSHLISGLKEVATSKKLTAAVEKGPSVESAKVMTREK